ncbi:hypothetical protein [Mycoplasma sp. Sp33II]|uniref:hypothetical protein n=1 Tax=unclassified Mycoplasma TaxID=2683645 RepID=UPI003AAF374F
MKYENAWIIFNFFLVSFAYSAAIVIEFGAILFLCHFKWENINYAIGNVILLINLIYLCVAEVLYFVYRVISDFNIQLRLSKKFRNQEIHFQNKTKNKFIGWIYKNVYFKKSKDNSENVFNSLLKTHKFKMQIYFFFWFSLFIMITFLIMNISYTIWYFSLNQNGTNYIWVIWTCFGFTILLITRYWRFRTYHYCKKHNLHSEMFDDSERLIRWIINSNSTWPYFHFSTVHSAFNWQDEYK